MSRAILVGMAMALALGLSVVGDVSAQRVRAGLSFRISDNLTASVGFGGPRDFAVYYRSPARYRRYLREASSRRHRREHRRLDRTHDRYHDALWEEHEELHYDLQFYPGREAERLHRRWHREVGRDHDAFHHELEHEHEDQHWDRQRGRHRGRRW